MGEVRQCAECGSTYCIEKHHVFLGPNRKISEKQGFVEDFCAACHRANNKEKRGIHFNKEMMLRYKQKHQRIYEETHTRAEWLKLIGTNYLEVEK